MTDQPKSSDKQDLLAAFDQVVEREKARAAESTAPSPARRRASAFVIGLCVLSWGLLAYTWLIRPAWLFPPDPASLMTPAQREATLRFGMYLESERIRDYLQAYRRLPARLEDAGDVEDGVEYAVIGDTTFVLTGAVGSTSLRLASTESAVEFLKPTGMTPPPRDQ